MTAVSAPTDQVTMVALAAISPHPLNRKRFDAAKLRELADSIASSGLLTPIVVRPYGDGYQLVAGERRWRAHGLLEKTHIFAIIRELTDEQAVEALVVENAQRENPHALEEADGYAALMDVSEGRITVAELAARVGKSESYILQRLKLRELGPEGREAFWKDEMTFSHALVVARLPQEKQAEALALAFHPDYSAGAKEGDRVMRPFREFAETIRDELHLPLKAAPFPTKDEALCPSAGSCVSCPKRTGFSPELFPEIAKKDDECTDRSCYDSKVKAFIAQQVEVARAKHGDALVLLTTGYKGSNPPNAGKPLCQSYWSEVKKGEKGATPGVLVRDDFGGRSDDLGKLLWVTVKKPLKAKGKSGTSSGEKMETQGEAMARQAKEKEAALLEDGRRRRLLDAVLAKVTKLPAVARIGLLLQTKPDQWAAKPIANLTKLPFGFGAKTQQAIARLTEADYAREAVLALVYDELGEWGVQRNVHPEVLLALAKELKLDAKAIMADPPAAKSTPKATAKSAAKKK